MNTEELKNLAERIKQGDKGAYKEFIKAYSSKVSEMVRKYAPQGADFKKLAVNTFTTAFKDIGSLKDGTSVENWLDAIAKQEVAKVYPEQSLKMKEDATVVIDSDDSTAQNKDGGTEILPDDKTAILEDNEASSDNEYQFDPATGKPLHMEPKDDRTALLDREDQKTEIISEDENSGEDRGTIDQPSTSQKNEGSAPEEPSVDLGDDDEDEAQAPAPVHKVYYEQDKPQPVYQNPIPENNTVPAQPAKKGNNVLLIVLVAVIALAAGGFIMYRLMNRDREDTVAFEPIEATADSAETETPAETASAAPVETEAPVVTEIPTPAPTLIPEVSHPTVLGSARVLVDRLNIREQPDKTSKSLGHVQKGSSYDVYEITTGGGYTWYRIGDGQWIADNGTYLSYTQY